MARALPVVKPVELLLWIASRMDMESEQSRARWPQLYKVYDAAHARWNRETGGGIRAYTSDPMVNGWQSAVHHWCDLPLMRASIGSVGGAVWLKEAGQ